MSDPLWSQLGRIVRRKVAEGQLSAPAIVTGRHTDGRIRVRRLDGDCEQSEGISRQGPGSVVLSTPKTPTLRQNEGTAGAGLAEITSIAPPTIFVESIEPATFECGKSSTVTVIGHGFTHETIFAFLLPDLSLNPDITILSKTFVDAETYALEILVAEDGLPLNEAPLGYDDPGVPL